MKSILERLAVIPELQVLYVSLFDPIEIDDCVAVALFDSNGELIQEFPLNPGEINVPIPFHSFFGSERISEGDTFYIQKQVIHNHEEGDPTVDYEYEKLIFNGKMY